ncbi:hypothetical protein [Acuticoccus sediminis]|uniref:hypothetical protein n=1 Tax=Acuticoccus sediminis TaxID=2184697 RepID=UPI001CFE2313|nr:hypothetical protein [Acuticoccus sediminis]
MKILCVEPRGEDADVNVLAEVLSGLGEVTRVAADPASPEADALSLGLAEPFGLCLFWRTEAVAARLLAFGLERAVIVPSQTPRDGAYWQAFTGAARFVTFSRRQHETLQAHECRSAYFDYWPEPAAAPPVHDFAPAAWSAVFVEGPHDTGVPSRGSVAQQCRHLGIEHLAAVGDTAEAGADGVEERALFVFASRARGLAAGIDHATRLAMGRGQIVVAPDAAPASETIGHLSSGILTDPRRPTDLPALDRETVERLSRGARMRAEIGRRTWLQDRQRLVSVLTDDGARWAGSDPSAHLGNAIQKALHRRRQA